MSSGIVFKQSYSSRTDSRTPGLNARNLHYIATRPGAVYNPGCGFGLWGRLPADAQAHTQMNLEHAEHVVREVSQRRTVYRVLLSVDGETASEHGLYHRENWQKLIDRRIDAIAKEMDISRENFCYLASMHCAKGHPHVHIQYWDNGTEPLNEAIAKPKFKAMSERIRAAFNREIFQEEISRTQKEQRGEQKQMRNALRALLLDANPEQGVSLSALYKNPRMPPLAEKLMEIAASIPPNGSLRYAYLPQQLRRKVDELVDDYLKLPELKNLHKSYGELTGEVSRLYGNNEATAERNLQKAEKKLHTELGNEIMQAVRRIREEMDLGEVSEIPQLESLLLEKRNYLRSQQAYGELLELLPKHRIPWPEVQRQIPRYKELSQALVDRVLSDWRTVGLINSCIRTEAQRLGVDPKDKDAMQDVKKSVWRDAARTLHRMLRDSLREDKGWQGEAGRTHAAQLAASSVFLLSRFFGQRQAQAAQQERRLASRDESKAAKKDRQAEQANESGWQE